MKTTTQVAILAMCVSLALTMTNAQAAITANGLALNGIPLNGLPLNGMPLNALTVNGLPMNGVALNGVPMNGMPLNGLALQVLPPAEPSPVGQYESLPWSTLSQQALGKNTP